MAMTKGLFAAVELRLRDGSDGDTSIPIFHNVSVILQNMTIGLVTDQKSAAQIDFLGQLNHGQKAHYSQSTSRIHTLFIARGTFRRGFNHL